MREEKWKPIIGWEGLYEVSDMGRVRSVRKAKNTFVGRIRSLAVIKSGYFGVLLADKATKRRKLAKVHRLVLAAFEGPSLLHANHKNGNKKDNRWPENLEYCTPQQNSAHAAEIGLTNKGSCHPKAKLTEDDIRHIRKSDLPAKDIARVYGITKVNVSYIRLRRSWKHVNP